MCAKRDLLLAAALLLCGWEIAALLLNSMALPQPWQVLTEFGTELLSGRLLDDILISGLRALAGVALGAVSAIPLGLLIGNEPALNRRLSPFIYLLYPMPHVVLLPLVIILFGIGNLSKIVLIGVIIFFQILVTTRDASRDIPPNYLYSLQTLGAGSWQLYCHVILPATLPKILTALRISIGTAVAILFFVESFATTRGLGYLIMDSWGRADYIALYSAITGMALLGFGLYLLLDRLERRFCPWNHLE
ncbi:ABC transporter permease [Desulfogranum mediterraneum]|uniref:ABC transporter permease n=1 Tax=Desulfogranum mediterraneum TaxID=160661 RepID=UPI000403F420|nr:ABC transporter permease [Desulfogranum mediterraneum]